MDSADGGLKILFIQKVKGWTRKKRIPETLSAPREFFEVKSTPREFNEEKTGWQLPHLSLIRCLCFSNVCFMLFFYSVQQQGGKKHSSPATSTQSETIKNIIAHRERDMTAEDFRSVTSAC